MTVAWRLASSRYPPLSGEGAHRVGGRWNSPGVPLVYASESLALCVAECLVHLPGRLPHDFQSVRLELPRNAAERLDMSLLKADWQDDAGYTRAIGDQWITQKRSLALIVPSAVLPESFNVLINPIHPEIDLVTVTAQPFQFDPRLRS